jgi:uridine kinase
VIIDQSLIAKIKSLNTPAIIGVSGFSGSGKTTFANLLSIAINAPVISIDSFNKGLNYYSYWELMDFKRIEEEVLIPFKSGNSITYTHYDGEPSSTSKSIIVKPQGILIVEGVFDKTRTHGLF